MDFVKYILTPKDTAENDPLVTKLKLTKGRLTGGFLYLPSGPAGVLHFFARIGIHQILPFNTGSNFRLDDAVVQFSLGIDLAIPPYVIDLITWNDSASYDHAMTVCFYLDPFAKPRYDIAKLKNRNYPAAGE